MNRDAAHQPQANIYDNIFDLSSGGVLQFGAPAGAVGFVVIFEPDLGGNATGSVDVFLGQGTGSLASRLASVQANRIRTGSTSNPLDRTTFTLVPSAGAQGLVRIKLTREPQPDASYSL